LSYMSNLKRYKADLHIHTALSPCAENDLTPENIVYMAVAQGLDFIAITDHNSAQNAGAVLEAARAKENELVNLVGHGLAIFPGMEITTKEEVHVLCLFDVLENAYAWQKVVFHNFPDFKNNPDFWGEQKLFSSDDRLMGYEERLLYGASNLGLSEVFEMACFLGGICIPSHIDKDYNGLLSVLGFVPEDIEIEAMEISKRYGIPGFVRAHPEVAGYPLLCFSDAHRLGEIGLRGVEFLMAEATIAELKEALANKNKRCILRVW